MLNVYYEAYYHLIWTTKKRLELINDEIENIILKAINGKIQEFKAKQIAINTHLNHCHLLVTISPKMSISDFVGQIKGYSSFEVNKATGEDSFKWQRGYGVVTLSKKGLPFVKKYVEKQKEYHRNKLYLVDILENVPED